MVVRAGTVRRDPSVPTSTPAEPVKALDDEDRLRDFRSGDAMGCQRIVMIGFCMGGMYVHKASADPRFERLVSFYGMIQPPKTGARTATASLDGAMSSIASCALRSSASRCAYAAGRCRRLEAVGVIVARYPEAEHGFVHDPASPAHRPDDGRRGGVPATGWRSSEP